MLKRNYKMTFIIGRGFAECQILKKWKWPYLLNWVEYFDKLLRKHWYWQDLAQEIANWHFLSVEALPSSKFWKSENGPISWTVKNIMMKFCIHIDIYKMQPKRLSNDIWDWSRFCRGSNSETKWNWPYLLNLLVYFDNILQTHYYWHDLDRGIAKSSPRDCKMTFNIGRGCAELQILKKWKWPNWVDYCDETLHTHWYWQDVAQEIVKCHLGLAEALPRFKFWKTVKLALSLETFWIFW